MALCHTIVTSKDPRDETKIILNSSSPDELSLLNAAKYFGVRFVERNEFNELVIQDEADGELASAAGGRGSYAGGGLGRALLGAPKRRAADRSAGGRRFQLLNVIEFTSERKRMTVVIQTPEGAIKVLSKGADSVLLPLLSPDFDRSGELKDKTTKHLQQFAQEGLRTLLLV